MPFDVNGWLEYNFEAPGERGIHSMWQPLLALGPFRLGGDEISSYLFGLAKAPSLDAPFRARGIPDDCCDLVRSEVERNEQFIARYGEGDFDHTWATWDEIVAVLGRPGAPSLPDDEADGGWRALFESVSFLSERIVGPLAEHAAHFRLIVSGNW